MSELTVALGLVAPYYNLILVIITAYFFIKLFRTPIKNKKVYLKPWKIIFIALWVFIIEEVLTVLRTAGYISIPIHINGFFELTIIALFIYTLLLQREYNKKM